SVPKTDVLPVTPSGSINPIWMIRSANVIKYLFLQNKNAKTIFNND
ncbi:MAG: hypothetical protein HRT73_02065, partial [Flavobacteriales bacterium]|nr:hypothetical protein [Flavobacteriales bacterium]